MNAPNRLIEEENEWRVSNPKGELLTISLLEVISDSSFEMGSDPGLQKDGVEAHIQELLAAEPSVLGEGFRLIRREFFTEIGPVDLLCKDTEDRTVAVEVKRRGEIDGVEQLTRYLDFLNRDSELSPVRGLYVAQEIKPQARVLAEDRGIECLVVDYDELRGIESNVLKLF
jgi:RecB family endonuclease NucS